MNFLAKKFESEKYRLWVEKVNPLDVYRQKLKQFGYCIALAGCNIFASGHSIINVVFLLTALNVITYIPINVYSLCILWGDLVDVTFCLATLGCGFQAIAKIYTLLLHKETFIELTRYTEKLFDHKTRPKKITNVLITWVVQMKFIAQVLAITFLSCLMLILISPLLVFLATGEKELMFGFQLPFIDPKSALGYPLNMAHHLVQLFLVVIGFLGTDGVYILFMLSGFCQLDVLKALLSDLNQLSVNNDEGENNEQIKESLNKIIQLHNEHIEYVIFHIFSVQKGD
jgi:hypothetical protein